MVLSFLSNLKIFILIAHVKVIGPESSGPYQERALTHKAVDCLIKATAKKALIHIFVLLARELPHLNVHFN